MEKLTLSYKCNQDWQQMPEKEAGRFCAQCNRCLIDFREKTLEEIAAIHANSAKPVCGIFKLEQVNYYNIPIQKRNPLRQVLAFATTLLAFAPKLEASEQLLPNRDFDNFQKDFPAVAYQMNSSKSENVDSTSLRGRILDKETGEPVPFVSILVKGTSYGFESDMDGYFKLNLTKFLNNKDSITLEFLYTGYETQEKTYYKDKVALFYFYDKVEMTISTLPLQEVIVVGYIGAPRKIEKVDSSNPVPVSEQERAIIDSVPGVIIEQKIQYEKYQKRSRLPWHKEFWQKRKQKKSNP